MAIRYNQVSVRISDSQGQPVSGVCLYLVPTAVPPLSSVSGSCSNSAGLFKQELIPSGQYLLSSGYPPSPPTARQPFTRFYYPGVTDKERAIALDIGVGTQLDGLQMSVPPEARLETVVLSGRMRFKDGYPVAKGNVKFSSAQGEYVDETVTGSDGSFRFPILAGVGRLQGNIWISRAQVEKCPQFGTLKPAAVGKRVSTSLIDIAGNTDKRQILLTLPFVSCKPQNPSR